MTAIGMGLAFLAYTGGLWGYCLIRGYNVTFLDMFKTAWSGSTAKAGGSAGTSGGSSGTSGGSSGTY